MSKRGFPLRALLDAVEESTRAPTPGPPLPAPSVPPPFEEPPPEEPPPEEPPPEEPPPEEPPQAPGDEGPLGRPLTSGEVTVLAESPLSWRLQWSSLRRADDDGFLPSESLGAAAEARNKRFPPHLFPRIAVKPKPNPGSNWLSIGPRNVNGRIKRLAIHPEDPDTIYAGAAGGGVWKTEDGGRSWRATMHEEQSLAIGAVAIDPRHPDTVYAGTGEPVYLLSSSASSAANLAWSYEGVGVYRTDNGGRDWQLTSPIANDFIYAIAVDPHRPGNVLCAGYSAAAGAGGLCHSADGGHSWRTVMPGVFTDVLYDPVNAGVAYAAQHGGGVLKSRDHGASGWQPRNAGLPSRDAIGRVNLAIAASAPNVLYAQVENAERKRLEGVYVTRGAAEGEGAWVKAAMPGVYGPTDQSPMVYWCGFIVADPTDPSGDTVWTGGVRIACSRDGGRHWQRVTPEHHNALPHVDHQHAAIHPTRPERIVVATDGGVFSGHVGDTQGPQTGQHQVQVEWRKISSGLVVTQFYDLAWSRACPSMVGGGSQDNGSLVTTGGRTWRQVLNHDGGYMAFHPTDSQVLFAQQPKAAYRRSDCGGAEFKPITHGLEEYMSASAMASVLAIDEQQPDRLFAGTNHVHRTLTGGKPPAAEAAAWTAVSGPLATVTEIAIAPSDPAVVYAGTIDGRLWRGTDGGESLAEEPHRRGDGENSREQSFHPVPAPPEAPARWLSAIAVDPADPHLVYVGFLGRRDAAPDVSDHVWRVKLDPGGGTPSWEPRSQGLLNVPVGAIVIDSASGVLYVACDVGVFRSSDGGGAWQPFDQGLPNVPVVDLALDTERRILYAATHGRGAYKLHLDGKRPDVVLCVRDSPIDNGDVTPSPVDVPDPVRLSCKSEVRIIHRDQSPDIKVLPAGERPEWLDGIEFDAVQHTEVDPAEVIPSARHVPPQRGAAHCVGVQVHNFGWLPSGTVTIKLLWAPVDADSQPPSLPPEFWSAFPADASGSGWRTVGVASVERIQPDTPWVALMDWNVGPDVPDRVCLLAIVDGEGDPLLPETEREPAELARKRRQVAYRVVDLDSSS